MRIRSKQNSQMNIQGYNQVQSHMNYYESQNQAYNDSPVRNKGQSKYGSNKKISQVASKIQDVIDMCVNDRGQGDQQFQSIANAEKGILDLLIGSDLHEINVPVGNFPSNQNRSFARNPSGNAIAFGGQNPKGSRPFIQISANTPQNINSQSKIRNQLPNNNPRQVVGDDALEMIQQIEKKAFMQIENLKRDKSELVRKLNEQIRLHNDEKRRREWCEEQIKRLMNFLEQNGFRVGQIQYPEWYFQITAPQQQQSGQSRYIQGNQKLEYPDQFNQINQAPSFAKQQTNQGFRSSQQYSYLQNQNKVSQNTASNNFNQLRQSQYIHRPTSSHPQQVQSTYQIGGPSQGNYDQGFNTVTNVLNQAGNLDGSYHQRGQYEDPTRNSQYRPQSPIQGYIVNPQNGQSIQALDYNNIRNGIQQLRQDNLYMKRNLPGNEGPEGFNTLQQRLIAAEQRARAYQKQISRWKMEASRKVGGDYPGLMDLLQQTQKIRRETIRLLKLKQAGRLGGQNRGGYDEYDNNQSRQENSQYRQEGYAEKSRKFQKGSFQTNALSPKSNYQSILQEVKRITKS